MLTDLIYYVLGELVLGTVHFRSSGRAYDVTSITHFFQFFKPPTMSAGDLRKNISQIVQDYATATRHERIIVSNLAAFSTKINLLMNLWHNSDGSLASKELLYDGYDNEHDNLRAYVSENRDEIVRILPALENSLEEYLAPNPYKNCSCPSHRTFADLQKIDFRIALADALINS